MKKFITFDVTLFGDVCGIVGEFTILAKSLTDLKGLICKYIEHYGLSGIGNVMVLAHTGSDSRGDKLYIAPSVKLNFVKEC